MFILNGIIIIPRRQLGRCLLKQIKTDYFLRLIPLLAMKVVIGDASADHVIFFTVNKEEALTGNI